MLFMLSVITTPTPARRLKLPALTIEPVATDEAVLSQVGLWVALPSFSTVPGGAFEVTVFSDVLESNRDLLKEGGSLILTLKTLISLPNLVGEAG